MKVKSYKSGEQGKNLAWYLPRPKPNRYKGGMPLYCEEWLIDLAKDIINMGYPRILNLFCGMNKAGIRVDIREEVNPDYCYDAHKISDLFPGNSFDIILADPPYSNEESEELYGTKGLNYRIWSCECDKVLTPGGLFIIYHKLIMPNPNPKKYFIVKRVFIGTRIYHQPRVAIYFQKKKWTDGEITNLIKGASDEGT
jgi:hypothetical protein